MCVCERESFRDVLSSSIIQHVSATAAHVMLLGEKEGESEKEEGEIDTEMWHICSL